jgi:2-haloacid dehalogenase
MPPHPEVPAALRRLREHGFRLFTLTDNTLAISGRQLEHGGIIDLFERRFSVDETSAATSPHPRPTIPSPPPSTSTRPASA